MKIITVPVREVGPDPSGALPPPMWTVLPGGSHLPQIVLEADTLLLPEQFSPVPTRRFVVLVPAGRIDEHALARRVWQLMSCSGLGVLYLALTPDVAQVSYQRQRLINLAALTAYPHVRAETKVHTEKNWFQALRYSLQPGDLLVCLAEDRAFDFPRRQVLGEWLAADLGLPVYEIGDLQVKPAPPSLYWFKDVVGWIASITLMAAFFLLQVRIDQSSARTQATILLCLSVLVELYGLWKINEWIG